MAVKDLKKNTPLTPQEKGFVKKVAGGGRVGDSALRSGFAHPSYGSYLMGQEKIQTAIKLALEKAGATDDLAAKRIKQGMSANLPKILYKDGEVKQKASPDHFNRRGYLDIYMKATGGYAPEKLEVQKKVVHINVDINMGKGLLDAGKINKAEFEQLKELEHEPIRENDDKGKAPEPEVLDT